MSRSIGDLSLGCHFFANKRSDGFDRLIDLYNNSTDEEKKLLSNECKIHFECCWCGNFFLNHLDLLTHKRVYCRPLCSGAALSCSTVTPDFAENARAEQNDDQIKKEASPQQRNKGRTETSLSTKTDSQSPKRAKIILKRTDATNVANKLHTEHCTSSQQNSAIVDGALVTVDAMLPDRVPVFAPRDKSSRYREMNLRNRKGDNSKNGIARKVGSEELKILKRMEKYQAMTVDLSSLTCSHSDCKEKQPFSSLFTFAYHLTVKHNRRALSNKRIPCYLCDFESQTYVALIEHLKSVHEQCYQEHITARSTSDELKRGRKGKQIKTAQMRGRSLSPISDDFLETEEPYDGSEEIGDDSAPVLDLMANMETENIELVAKISRSISKKQKYGSSICLYTTRKGRVKDPVLDEVAGPSKAENGRKQRPSRQLRKPNWIDENYIIGFKNKRTRRDDDVYLECAQPKRQSPQPSKTEKSRIQSEIELKYTKNADRQRSAPVEFCDNIHRIQSETSSGETSKSSTPTPIDEEQEGCTSSKDTMEQGTDSSNDRYRASQSRRKQDLSTIHENNDDVMIVHYSKNEDSLPKDLSDSYFTETERDLFFSLIHPASPSSDNMSNAHGRMQCGDIIANVPECEVGTKRVSHAR
ncbi:unnamed protein product [Litomosoides sigmodontis]|uniref:C2H2-type domain-containing protein n=1 Tax=Litomosoides sigmodontis TaxID=42156 RepID=A0A3P6TWM2_LITSI|nr:unnamed protein product [Litomosoides sigmodontis]